ncbi:hypothetical protein ACFU99_33405 [Streptomyces sp. NPDC057654]|uniref:hypothetical protein n=1 Tax=Streptomyces sp. NPDC057654 TaxID=3346196 RepID=UPI0036BDB8D6
MITKVVLPGLAEPSAQQAPARGTATGTLSVTRPRVTRPPVDGPRLGSPRLDGSQRFSG